MIPWLNCLMAGAAAAVNVWSAMHGPARLAVVRFIRAALAAAFAAVYSADLAGIISLAERVVWGQALALIAWPLVWMLPALIVGGLGPDPDAVVAEVRRRMEVP